MSEATLTPLGSIVETDIPVLLASLRDLKSKVSK